MRSSLFGKKIILGISGSIAAYKACYLIRGLIKKGAEVQVVITESGKHFITPTTLSTLTSKPCISEFFAENDGSWHSHVDLGLWADVMIVAPATASTIGKMANGIADNMLVTTYLSCKAPVYVAPAMDLDMYRHPSTINNIEKLKSYGNTIIEAESGELASHLMGKGRMQEPERIVEILENHFDELANVKVPLNGAEVMITAGPTYECIDPVRFISNYSSGKMGMALANVFARKGAHVTVVAGPGVPRPYGPASGRIEMVDVVSAQQMFDAVQLHKDKTILVMCAAVADFTPEHCADKKIRREGDQMMLTLTPTKDIAAFVGHHRIGNQTIVGFSLETHNALEHAQEKRNKKQLDMIVMNSLEDEGAGFGGDSNKVTLISNRGNRALPLMSKTDVAEEIVSEIIKLRT